MRVLIAWLAILAATPTLADTRSGNFWLGVCDSKVQSDASACTFYIAGYLQGRGAGRIMQAYATRTLARDDTFCIPEGVNIGQLRLVVLKYLKAQPERLHWQFNLLITLGLEEGFPCGPDTPLQQLEKTGRR